MGPTTKAEQIMAWIEEEIGKVPGLGIAEHSRVQEADSLTLGITTEEDEYVFITVEQG